MNELSPSSLLYVAGAGRSGSTLLDWLLGNHSRISAVGEVHRVALNPDERLCSCGESIVECPYWSQIAQAFAQIQGSHAEGIWERYPVTIINWRARRFPPSVLEMSLLGNCWSLKAGSWVSENTRAHRQMAENRWWLCDAIKMCDGSEWVLDSTKNAVRMKTLYLTRSDRFKMVHLLRDGRAVTASACRRLGISVQEGTRRWARSVRNVLSMAITIPGKKDAPSLRGSLRRR